MKKKRSTLIHGNCLKIMPTLEANSFDSVITDPPAGLDPFAGSGSTGKAARLEGFRFLGIEQDANYAKIARRRIG